MIDKVNWCDPHQLPESQREKEKNEHTKGIRADVVAGETVHLRKFSAMDRADVEEILPTFPH